MTKIDKVPGFTSFKALPFLFLLRKSRQSAVLRWSQTNIRMTSSSPFDAPYCMVQIHPPPPTGFFLPDVFCLSSCVSTFCKSVCVHVDNRSGHILGLLRILCSVSQKYLCLTLFSTPPSSIPAVSVSQSQLLTSLPAHTLVHHARLPAQFADTQFGVPV